MAQATFYTFSKRGNSTAVPTGAGTAVDVVLKDGTSLIDPVFLLQLSTVPAWSMMQFEGRYYKITNITSVKHDLWEVSATVDVLATYKTNIQAASAFVLYDTAANTELIDKRLSAVTTPNYAVNTSGNFEYIGRGACVAVDVVGANGSDTYLMTVSDAAELLNDIDTWAGVNFDDIIWDDSLPAEEALVDVLQQIGQNVVTAIKDLIAAGSAPSMLRGARLMCFPVSGGDGDSVNSVMLGNYSSGKPGVRQSHLARTSELVSVSIPWTFSDWRRNSPYTQIFLYSPYFGLVELPTSELIGKGQIDCSVSFSSVSGDALFMLSAVPSGGGASIKLGHYSCNLSSPHLIGSSNVSAWNQVMAVTSGGMAIGTALAAGPVGAAMGTRGIMGMLDHIRPLAQTIGTAGGSALLALGLPPPLTLIEVTHNTNVAPDSVSAIIGTPTNAVKSLAGLSGYVETHGFSVSGSMTDRERADINRLMDGGVYIE